MDDSPIAFVARWTESIRSIQSTITSPSFVASPLAVATLTSNAQTLGEQLTEQAEQLPAYELGRCERELKNLLESISAAKSKSTAKAKFSFKRTAVDGASSSSSPKSAVPPSSSTPSSVAPAPSKPSPAPPPIPATSLALSDRSGEFLSLANLPLSSSSAAKGGKAEALLLSALEDCFVDLTSSAASKDAKGAGEATGGGAEGGASFSALYLYNLKRCVVLVEPIEGSVMLHGCEGCLIVLGCHQFRMHNSSDCKIFLHISSTPIIEHCRGLRFGPYPSFLSSLPLSPTSSFAEVQDFDHPFPSPTDPSPSFRVLASVEGAPWEGEKSWRAAMERRKEWRRLLEVGWGAV